MQFRNICIIISTFNILSNCLILSTLPCDLKVSLRTYIFKILSFIFFSSLKKIPLIHLDRYFAINNDYSSNNYINEYFK